MLKNKDNASLAEYVKNKIAQDITAGLIKPGEKITEELYAEKFCVSRAPVREAILMLITEGIAYKIKNRGTFLRKFTLIEHIDICQLRFFLEIQALKKISQFTDNQTLFENLRKYTQMFSVAKKNDLFSIVYADYHFHFSLIKHCKSNIYIEKYPTIYSSMHYIQQENYCSNVKIDIDDLSNQHEAIIESLQDRNFGRAISIISAYSQNLIQSLYALDKQYHSQDIVY